MEKKILSHMALLRMISGIMEITAALLILRLHRVEAALRVNAVLGLLGPVFFLAVSALGIVALAVRVSPAKIMILVAGACLILWGTKC